VELYCTGIINSDFNKSRGGSEILLLNTEADRSFSHSHPYSYTLYLCYMCYNSFIQYSLRTIYISLVR